MTTNRNPVALAFALFALIPVYDCFAATPTSKPTSQPVSNADNTFSLMIGEAWTRTDKNASGDGNLLDIRIVRDGQVFAYLYVFRSRVPADVHGLAQSYVKQAKSDFPDLNKDCAVERVKVDGSEALLVTDRRRGAHFREYFVIRDDHLYSISCMARDSALDEMQQQINDAIGTFSWTKQK